MSYSFKVKATLIVVANQKVNACLLLSKLKTFKRKERRQNDSLVPLVQYFGNKAYSIKIS